MLDTLGVVSADMQAQGAAAMLVERFDVAHRLGADEGAEGVVLAGDGQVAAGVARYLDEHARVGPSFVQLAGGVEKARAIAEGGGHFEGIADAMRASWKSSSCSPVLGM